LNDLYHLPYSVFNDDNLHTVLTVFDMMMLKAYYSLELRSGMTRGHVSQALPHILNRINPAGNGRAEKFATRSPKAWAEAVQAALGPGSKTSQRITAVNQASKITNAIAGMTTVWHLCTMQVAASCWLLSQKPRFNILSLLTATMLRPRVLIYTARMLRHNLLHTQLHKAMACVRLL
jgi:hypothetical protein